MEYINIIFQEVYKILFLLVPVLVSVAMIVWLDRRVWAFVQKRQGPNVVGPFGLLQSLADALKYIFKEIIIPASSNKIIFILAPIITMTLALIAWAVIPFGEGQVLANINVGILYIFAVSSDIDDLKKRIGNMVVGYSRSNEPIRAKQLNADGAITALLKDAFQPNLVQTLENNPAFIHGGPFANIAHGCNSVVSTKLALKLADYVVTEAGFGADLGAEKFFDIKCRKSGLKPDAVVLVATTKALKMHGGIAKDNLGGENVDAVTQGCKNLERHIENITKFGVPVIVAINDYVTDTKDEHAAIINYCNQIGVECKISSHWEKGGKGASDLAEEVVKIADSNSSKFKPLYDNKMSLWDKTEYVAKNIYGASQIIADVCFHKITNHRE